MEWQPIETCPETGFFLVEEDTAIRTMWRYKGVWSSPQWPGLLALGATSSMAQMTCGVFCRKGTGYTSENYAWNRSTGCPFHHHPKE